MNHADFTRGRIVLPLVRFVFPILFAMLIQSLYGAVDLLVVGRFSDAAGVSAVSIGSQLMMSVTMVIAQLSAGSAILLGQSVGSGRKEACGPIVGTTVFFFTLLGLVLAVLMQPLARPVTAALNAPGEAANQAGLGQQAFKGRVQKVHQRLDGGAHKRFGALWERFDVSQRNGRPAPGLAGGQASLRAAGPAEGKAFGLKLCLQCLG